MPYLTPKALEDNRNAAKKWRKIKPELNKERNRKHGMTYKQGMIALRAELEAFRALASESRQREIELQEKLAEALARLAKQEGITP